MVSSRLEQALASLQAHHETERLAAARTVLELVDDLTPEVDQAISEALASEKVPWVRGVLEDILSVGEVPLDEGVSIPVPRWSDDLDGLDADTARQVLNASTRRVLHEVSAVVGRVRLAAVDELGDDYLDSETSAQLGFLVDVCSGLRSLAEATGSPEPREFDLSLILAELASSLENEYVWPIRASGPSPFMVTTDWALLRLAVTNVLRNAVEASQSLGAGDDSRAIVLTWGLSADGIHTTVIDRGPGPPRAVRGLMRPGVSTKSGHAGYGLATASEAMRSLGGSVEIQRNDRGGATVVLSWGEAGG